MGDSECDWKIKENEYVLDQKITVSYTLGSFS